MISTGDVKKGVIIELDGQLMKVLDWTHIKTARGSALFSSSNFLSESTWYLVTVPFSSNSTTRLCGTSPFLGYHSPNSGTQPPSQEEAFPFPPCIKSPELLNYLGAGRHAHSYHAGIRFRFHRSSSDRPHPRAHFYRDTSRKKDAYENRQNGTQQRGLHARHPRMIFLVHNDKRRAPERDFLDGGRVNLPRPLKRRDHTTTLF